MTEFAITAYTRDGQVLSFPCSRDESLLAAAQRQDIILPSQCRNGSCGACTAQVRTGTVAANAPATDDRPLSKAAARNVLLCQATPRSALIIDLPYDHTFVRFEPVPERLAEITALDVVAPGTYHLRLSLVRDAYGCAAEFEAGQYMEILVPGTTQWRAYSLMNITNWEGCLEFVIARRPEGLFGRYLETASLGDRLRVKGPLGVFTLQENGLHPRWFIGGHTGIAPLLSMLRRMADWGEGHPVRVYFAVHDEQDLFLMDTLEDLRQRLPALEVKTCVSAPATRGAHQGNVIDTLDADLATAPVPPDCYVCGSPRLVQGVMDRVTAHGVPRERVYFERFSV